MTRVAIVANGDVVRVTAQSEHAVEASFKTWTEAVAYCKGKEYEIFNQSEADEYCALELEILEEAAKEGEEGKEEGEEGKEESDA